ncbi:hypothetical protein BD779DRAFT_1669773 [Infundibulicybe gibba]|nr:hypothetical protein BD779DRAFT_1669773 [Infundibulicybe gibba]
MNPTLAHDLAPLASQVFRNEVTASCSNSRLSLSSLRSSLQILASVDTNSENKKHRKAQSGSGSQTSRLSAKALGKRKGVFISESIESIAATFSSTPSAHSSVATGLGDSALPLDAPPPRLSDDMSESSCAPGPSQIKATPDSIALDTTSTVNYSSTLYAEKALKSLERICADFDSGSLGSLRTITEESEGENSSDRTLRAARNDQSEPISSSSDDSILDAPTAPTCNPPLKSTTPPSAKKSMLPVFRNLRRLSLTGSPANPKPDPKPVVVSPKRKQSGTLRRPTVSSALKVAETSPTRSFLAKKTLPLQINKKNMGPSYYPKQMSPTKTGKRKSLSKGTENVIPAAGMPKENRVPRRLSRIMA